MNHHEPLRTTTNHYEPPQSLMQNEIWYWILDSDWLNSWSHDIFLRILEKNYHEPPRITTNHHEPPRTMTVNHDSEPWHEPRQWTMTFEPWQWTTTFEPRHLNHDEIASFAGGSRRWECTVLEIFDWFPASKTGRNRRSRTNLCITGNLPGCLASKKVRKSPFSD